MNNNEPYYNENEQNANPLFGAYENLTISAEISEHIEIGTDELHAQDLPKISENNHEENANQHHMRTYPLPRPQHGGDLNSQLGTSHPRGHITSSIDSRLAQLNQVMLSRVNENRREDSMAGDYVLNHSQPHPATLQRCRPLQSEIQLDLLRSIGRHQNIPNPPEITVQIPPAELQAILRNPFESHPFGSHPVPTSMEMYSNAGVNRPIIQPASQIMPNHELSRIPQNADEAFSANSLSFDGFWDTDSERTLVDDEYTRLTYRDSPRYFNHP